MWNSVLIFVSALNFCVLFNRQNRLLLTKNVLNLLWKLQYSFLYAAVPPSKRSLTSVDLLIEMPAWALSYHDRDAALTAGQRHALSYWKKNLLVLFSNREVVHPSNAPQGLPKSQPSEACYKYGNENASSVDRHDNAYDDCVAWQITGLQLPMERN